MEAGTHSIWISEQLQELGHQALMKVHGVGHITALTYVLTLGTRNASSEVET